MAKLKQPLGHQIGVAADTFIVVGGIAMAEQRNTQRRLVQHNRWLASADRIYSRRRARRFPKKKMHSGFSFCRLRSRAGEQRGRTQQRRPGPQRAGFDLTSVHQQQLPEAHLAVLKQVEMPEPVAMYKIADPLQDGFPGHACCPAVPDRKIDSCLGLDPPAPVVV